MHHFPRRVARRFWAGLKTGGLTSRGGTRTVLAIAPWAVSKVDPSSRIPLHIPPSTMASHCWEQHPTQLRLAVEQTSLKAHALSGTVKASILRLLPGQGASR